MESKTALIFFFGLFWASALGSITEFRAFDTAGWFRQDGLWRGIRRFSGGVVIANILPLTLLWFLYTSDWLIPPNRKDVWAIFAAAVASLGVFFVPRIMHAFLATPWFWNWFYTEEEWSEVVKDAKADPKDSFWAHFVPGVGYIIVFTFFAWLLNRN